GRAPRRGPRAQPRPRFPPPRSRLRSRAGRTSLAGAARALPRGALVPKRVRPGLPAGRVDELEPSIGAARRPLEACVGDLLPVRVGQDLAGVPVAEASGADGGAAAWAGAERDPAAGAAPHLDAPVLDSELVHEGTRRAVEATAGERAQHRRLRAFGDARPNPGEAAVEARVVGVVGG